MLTDPLKYCRICFEPSSDKMMELKIFLPIIKFIAQTKIPSDDQSKICYSCGNSLILANLIRIKVIKSNATYKNLLASKDSEKLITNNEDDEDNRYEVFETFELKLIENESSEEVEKVPVKRKDVDDTSKERNQKLQRNSKTHSKMKRKIPKKKSKSTHDMENGCSVCGEQNPSNQILTENLKSDLEKILPYSDDDNLRQICRDCFTDLNLITSFNTKYSRPKIVQNGFCQFCVKIKSHLYPLEKCLFQMYNEFPFIKRKLTETARTQAKTCRECMRMFKQMYEFREKFKVKRRFERRRLQDAEKSLQVNSMSDESISVDYQCHMSDIEEQDDDYEIPPVRFGDPLNIPFTPNYLQCPECPLKCITSLEFETHVECFHRTLTTQCNICAKNFPNKILTRRHKQLVHFQHCSVSTLDYRSLCHICGVLIKNFKEHFDMHADVKSYECHLCGHTARSKHRIENHILAIHENAKKFKCQYCDKGFNYQPDKMRHEIGSHTKKYRHVCVICKKGFVKKNFLTAHQKTHE